MIDECKHHTHTDHLVTPLAKGAQRTLANQDDFLSLGPPAPPVPRTRLHRTPAGKAVRNIANTPYFNTANPSLTSFLRFPPEIRIQIYGYLLISYQIIQYGVCPVKLCLIRHERRGEPPVRHRIFPSILESCRIINEEGSNILYSMNMFKIEHYSSYLDVVDIYAPSQPHLLSITRLDLISISWASCLQDRKILELMGLFPRLREVNIHFADVLVEEWVAFLAEASDKLRCMQKFILEIDISQNAGTVICNRWPSSQFTDEKRCLLAYRRPFLKQGDVWKDRKVRWEFYECTDNFSRSHCVLGILRVIVE